MRNSVAIVLVLGFASSAMSQEGRKIIPKEPPPRFGISYRGKLYRQDSPKESLKSAIDAIEKDDFTYLVAHLLDPAFVEARIGDRARRVSPSIEANLATLRDFQQQNLDRVEPESRVPIDADKFRARVATDAKAAAFKLLVRDVRGQFAEDPALLRDFRRFRGVGLFPEDTGIESAKVTLADVKDRFLFFKKIGDRWFLEEPANRSSGAEKGVTNTTTA